MDQFRSLFKFYWSKYDTKSLNNGRMLNNGQHEQSKLHYVKTCMWCDSAPHTIFECNTTASGFCDNLPDEMSHYMLTTNKTQQIITMLWLENLYLEVSMHVWTFLAIYHSKFIRVFHTTMTFLRRLALQCFYTVGNPEESSPLFV